MFYKQNIPNIFWKQQRAKKRKKRKKEEKKEQVVKFHIEYAKKE